MNDYPKGGQLPQPQTPSPIKTPLENMKASVRYIKARYSK